MGEMIGKGESVVAEGYHEKGVREVEWSRVTSKLNVYGHFSWRCFNSAFTCRLHDIRYSK